MKKLKVKKKKVRKLEFELLTVIGCALFVFGCHKPCACLDARAQQKEFQDEQDKQDGQDKEGAPAKPAVTASLDNSEAKPAATIESLDSFEAKLNYIVGADVAKSFRRNEVGFISDAFMQGFRDFAQNKTLLFTEEERRTVKRQHSRKMLALKTEQRKRQAEQNAAAGAAFLEKNKTEAGIITLESGLQYRVIREGDGLKPVDGDSVLVHYTGTLIDGTEFDSSYKRGTPADFKVNRVIKGWQEALLLMPVGSKWQLFIPSELGYGSSGSGSRIGPNQVLLFDVELLEVKEKRSRQFTE